MYIVHAIETSKIIGFSTADGKLFMYSGEQYVPLEKHEDVLLRDADIGEHVYAAVTNKDDPLFDMLALDTAAQAKFVADAASDGHVVDNVFIVLPVYKVEIFGDKMRIERSNVTKVREIDRAGLVSRYRGIYNCSGVLKFVMLDKLC